MEDKTPQSYPVELRNYHLCCKFNCLPDSGGLLDQDPKLLEAFILIMNIEEKHRAFTKKKDEARNKSGGSGAGGSRRRGKR